MVTTMALWVRLFSQRFLSKWLVLLVDVVILTLAFMLATLLQFKLQFTYPDPGLFKYHLILVLGVKVMASLVFGAHSGVIRHTGLEDAWVLFKTQATALVVLLLPGLLTGYWAPYVQVPPSVLFIDFFVSLFALFFTRLLIKSAFEGFVKGPTKAQPIIIYGAGLLGRKVKEALTGGFQNPHILCFVDDNRHLIGKMVSGKMVLSLDQAVQRYVQAPAYQDNKPTVLFAIQEITLKDKKQKIAQLVDLGLVVKVTPPVQQWMDGRLEAQQIQSVKIEDLLNREPIQITNHLISDTLMGRVVMVTGAAGSIGSELVRQIVKFQPASLILVDHAESALYDLETELTRLGTQEPELADAIDFQIEVADVAHWVQMETLFARTRPDLVFHAAAYKHVPLMEKNPSNAVRVNVLGTQVVADLASLYRVKKFIMVSTDKAVNPTNVMGATKRLAEMYVHGLNMHHGNDTRFIITRFGNVLGSNGSVIPLFKKQIASGGPLTVTHPDIIRYFMTIPEACQLVLEAGTMGRGGEIFVFDMGDPVKIVHLAKRMIQLSGLKLGKDIDIAFTGLRPGEKLYEELLGDTEKTLPTHHDKIMVAKIKATSCEHLREALYEMERHLYDAPAVLVAQLKALVPEFVSQNSTFADLDSPLVDHPVES